MRGGLRELEEMGNLVLFIHKRLNDQQALSFKAFRIRFIWLSLRRSRIGHQPVPDATHDAYAK